MRLDKPPRPLRITHIGLGHVTIIALLVMSPTVLIPAKPLSAKSLTLNTCLALWRQTKAAKTNGLDDLMAKGPEGATARLSKAQLAQIKSHIALVERLKFRCRQFVPPPPGTDLP